MRDRQALDTVLNLFQEMTVTEIQINKNSTDHLSNKLNQERGRKWRHH